MVQRYNNENSVKENNMFCANCGIKIEEGIKFCPNCGSVIDSTAKSQIDTENKNLVKQKVMAKQGDSPSLGFAILSCLFPIIGLILFFV